MTIHEFGKENEQILVLLHPAGVWWNIYDKVIPILQKQYHVIVPAMPGHDPDHPESDYTNVETIARELEDWLIGHRHRKIDGIYGCSMGGGVVTRIVADHRLWFKHIVIDAGMTPYQLPKICTYLIALRDFCAVELGKHCSMKILSPVFSGKKYSAEELLYGQKMLKSMSAKTIWNTLYSCNNYRMPQAVKQPHCPMQYWYGSEEKKERRLDIAYMKKTFPQIQLVENKRMGHAEFFLLHPEKFCEQLMAFMK